MVRNDGIGSLKTTWGHTPPSPRGECTLFFHSGVLGGFLPELQWGRRVPARILWTLVLILGGPSSPCYLEFSIAIWNLEVTHSASHIPWHRFVTFGLQHWLEQRAVNPHASKMIRCRIKHQNTRDANLERTLYESFNWLETSLEATSLF